MNKKLLRPPDKSYQLVLRPFSGSPFGLNPNYGLIHDRINPRRVRPVCSMRYVAIESTTINTCERPTLKKCNHT